MTDLSAHGITATLPRGWDGRISRRSSEPRGGVTKAAQAGIERPVVHLGTMPLPVERGDFGSGVVERMGPTDVLVCIVEFDDPARSGVLFDRHGVPRFSVRDFSPDSMQRTISGMCGAQAFFTEAGRTFCAYVVLGSLRARPALVPIVNEVMATVRIRDSASG